jgi:hypothetical protein
MKLSLASLPRPLRNSRVRIGGRGVAVAAAPLAVEVRSPLRPPAGGSSESSLGRKFFMLADASMSVPSTEKCSSESRRLTSGRSRTAARKRPATSPLEEPLAVGREGRRMPDWIVDPEPHEPAVQQVVVRIPARLSQIG